MPKKIKEDKKETSITLPDEASVAIIIKDETDMSKATSVLSVLNKYLDELTRQKELLTKPLNAALKEIRSRYKVPEEKLESKINEIRKMMISYKTEQVQLQAKKEQELAEKVANGKISIEKAADKLNKLPEVIKNTEVAEGSVKFKPVKCFEVVDMALLPIELHLPNTFEIRARMISGIEEPGVKYWTGKAANQTPSLPSGYKVGW